MNIIQTTSALAPEFGGPARTVPALCLELAKLGNNVTLIYLNFGEPFSEPILPVHPNLQYHSQTVKIRAGMRPVWVPGYQSTLKKLASGKDRVIFHDNGIWLPYSRQVIQAAQAFGAPVITTTHGMLEPWAMKYGRLRKLVAWNVYQKQRLKNNSMLHATSQEEADNLRKLGLTTPITVIPNGTTFPEQTPNMKPSEDGEKKILFLSRIHPKKGLLNLVKAIDYLRPKKWRVIIGGYDEEGYQAIVETAVLEAGVEDFFKFIGPVDDHKKWELYNSADLFILPSFSENFGIVVIEALATQTPVITTWGTPWKDLVEYNCGWWVEPSVQGIAESLKNAIDMDEKQLNQMGVNGRKLVEKKYTWPAIARDILNVYQEMLDGYV